MPIHDWTRVSAGIFHHFHLEWIGDLSRVLNRGLLPPDYYALAEQFAGGLGPDVLTLQRPDRGSAAEDPALGIALATTPPQVQHHMKAEPDVYAAKARSVIIRHASNHQIIAMLEVVSPGNKNTRHALRTLVDKAVSVLRAGIHLVVVDLFPPGPRDPQGIHKAIWDEFIDNDFHLFLGRFSHARLVHRRSVSRGVRRVDLRGRSAARHASVSFARVLRSASPGENLRVSLGSGAVLLARRVDVGYTVLTFSSLARD